MSRFSDGFKRRAKRVRYKIHKSAYGQLRLSVFRSERNMYAQIIDDVKSITLCSASTIEKDFRKTMKTSGCAAAVKIGEMVASRASEKGIKNVVFDRGGCKYHGRIKALADGARSGGLVF